MQPSVCTNGISLDLRMYSKAVDCYANGQARKKIRLDANQSQGSDTGPTCSTSDEDLVKLSSCGSNSRFQGARSLKAQTSRDSHAVSTRLKRSSTKDRSQTSGAQIPLISKLLVWIGLSLYLARGMLANAVHVALHAPVGQAGGHLLHRAQYVLSSIYRISRFCSLFQQYHRTFGPVRDQGKCSKAAQRVAWLDWIATNSDVLRECMMSVQLADLCLDEGVLAQIGSALRGPFHEALGIHLPQQLRHSPRVNTNAHGVIPKPTTLDWVVQVRRSQETVHHRGHKHLQTLQQAQTQVALAKPAPTLTHPHLTPATLHLHHACVSSCPGYHAKTMHHPRSALG